MSITKQIKKNSRNSYLILSALLLSMPLMTACELFKAGAEDEEAGTGENSLEFKQANAKMQAACKNFSREPAKNVSQNICQKRADSEVVTELSHASHRFSELSGMRAHGNQIYYINDSGDDSYFYFTSLSGSGYGRVEIQGYDMRDFEAIEVAPCQKTNSATSTTMCLVLADTGNDFHRAVPSVVQQNLVFVQIPDGGFSDGAQVSPYAIVSLNFAAGLTQEGGFVAKNGYPDFKAIAYNSATQSLYLINKSATYHSKKYWGTNIFKVGNWNATAGGTTNSTISGAGSIALPKMILGEMCGTVDFDPLKFEIPSSKETPFDKDEINFEELIKHPMAKAVITDMDFSTDGKSLLMATYGGIWELDFDIRNSIGNIDSSAASSWELGKEYRLVRETSMIPLVEGVSYLPDSRNFVMINEVDTNDYTHNAIDDKPKLVETDCSE